MIDITYNIFEELVDNTINEILLQSDYNSDLKLASLTKIENGNITVGDYIVEKKTIALWGVKKSFYDVYYDNRLEIENIGSSLLLVKILLKLLDNHSITINDPLPILNARYVGVISDALYYKSRLISNSSQSDLTKNVYQAKYEGCIDALHRVNEQINKIS